jgi:SulP family sulfate permease
MPSRLSHYVPLLGWARDYSRATLAQDLTAAVIVTIMLIPQSLAYALLAGLPPEAGLYASIAPIVLYAVFGTSKVLAVGPVAVISLMTAAALGQIVEQGTMGYALAAMTLALLSGIVLLAMGLLRLGMLANFLSHPVIAGFITASGLIIAASQVKHILGIWMSGHTLIELLHGLITHLNQINIPTLAIGLASIAFLWWVRGGLKPLLIHFGLSAPWAGHLARTGPVFAVVATTVIVWLFRLDLQGVAIVGQVPQGLPPLAMPNLSPELIANLLVPALLISVIGFVESVSVASTLAAKRRQRIDPNQELIGLGAANIGAGFTGGYPVTGGFARSVVNFDAGAQTPAAGAYTAVGIALAAMTLTPLIHFLPKATLAATIIVAVLSLVDFSILKSSWRYAKSDFAAVLGTILVTLGFGVETGVSTGVGLSIALFLFKNTRPHIAEVGRVPGTEHFRNIRRHEVITDPHLVTLRVDESLFFANARFLEDHIYDRVIDNGPIRHVVLMCSAVNEIDFSALESLEAINERLMQLDVKLHLSEVKGPVMDRLRRSAFIENLSGEVFLSQNDAFEALRA